MMRERQIPPMSGEILRALPLRDTVIVILVTVAAFVVASHFEFNEYLYKLSRNWEYFQADEMPTGLLVLCLCLIWMAWRRYHEAVREVSARRIAEERLASTLTENRRLSQENLRIQEAERKHLARELHDELGQYLNAIKLDAVSITQSPGNGRDAALAIIRSVDRVHRSVSDMIGRLRPVGLDELGLTAAVEHCVEHWRERLPGMSIVLTLQGEFDALPEGVCLTVYRLIQEGLTNAGKHSHAKRVEITLQRISSPPGQADDLQLSIADDGDGMQAEAPTRRFGLHGMRERVEMMGGVFSVNSGPGRGVTLEARLPAVELLR